MLKWLTHLEVQMSVDGFIAGFNGEIDSMTWDLGNETDHTIKGYNNDF